MTNLNSADRKNGNLYNHLILVNSEEASHCHNNFINVSFPLPHLPYLRKIIVSSIISDPRYSEL